MLAADLVPEDIAGQIELADLAAAVGQNLRRADGAADELVKVFGWLVFAVDFAVAGTGHDRAHHVEGVGQRV